MIYPSKINKDVCKYLAVRDMHSVHHRRAKKKQIFQLLKYIWRMELLEYIKSITLETWSLIRKMFVLYMWLGEYNGL